MKVFRVPGLIVIIGLLVGAVILDQGITLEEAEVDTAAVVPVSAVAADDARSSTWFCAAATDAEGAANSEIVLSNTTVSPASAIVSVFRGAAETLTNPAVTEQVLSLIHI